MGKWTSIFIIVSFFLSCGKKQSTETSPVDPRSYDRNLENANKYFSRSDALRIEDYCRRHNLETKETGTGLRYTILEQGEGDPIADKDEVTFHYTIKLINDMVVESSTQKGPKKVIVGYTPEISGLTEGLYLLKKGDRALFIIPSHLAYGWVPASSNIPPKSILIYEIKIVDVKKPNNILK